VNRFV